MSNISCVRAGVSCVPVIGPFVSIYNAYEVKSELHENPIIAALSNMQVATAAMGASLSALSGSQQGIETFSRVAQQQANEQEGKVRKQLVSCEKGRVYSICGIVGNVLTVALIITLVCLDVFTGVRPIIFTALFVFMALVSALNLYTHNQSITNLRAGLAQLPPAPAQ